HRPPARALRDDEGGPGAGGAPDGAPRLRALRYAAAPADRGRRAPRHGRAGLRRPDRRTKAALAVLRLAGPETGELAARLADERAELGPERRVDRRLPLGETMGQLVREALQQPGSLLELLRRLRIGDERDRLRDPCRELL